MLRRIPTTPLVCLVVCVALVTLGSAWAATPDESLEILLKPEKAKAPSAPAAQKARPRYRRAPRPVPPAYGPMPPWPGPKAISKVKPPACLPVPYQQYRPPCVLPKPMPRQWEMSAQALFARTRGTVAWPRQNQFFTFDRDENRVDFNDDLGIPAHDVLLSVTARYQFRPSWAVRYSGLFDELSGSTWPQRIFWFGTVQFSQGTDINGKWEHGYHRIGLVYDPIKTCSVMVSVFADWVHVDDKISINCSFCGNQTSSLSKGTDSAIAGIELQRCIKTAINGGTLSFDHKAGVIFLDNVEGWDLQTGLRYSVPLGCGRSGFLKGGYRYVELKKQQEDLILNSAIEGGFAEFGFIF